jgi:glycosyltransferase involved in cell wall biosynthesis
VENARRLALCPYVLSRPTAGESAGLELVGASETIEVHSLTGATRAVSDLSLTQTHVAARTSNSMRVLVNVPDLALPGGVAAYWRVVRNYLPNEIEYFTSGARLEKTRPIGQIFRLVRDYWVYLLRVTSGGYSLLQLNPSLDKKALLRDGLFLLFGKALRKKVVIFVHGWRPDCERVIREVFPWLFRAIYFNADAIIVLASEFRQRLLEWGYAGPIFVETIAIEAGLTEFPIRRPADRRFRVLFLARVERDKGILEAIEAYGQTKAKHPEMEMVVAGDGPLLEGAQEYARRHGIEDVSFWGHVSGARKVEAFMNADCYLFPTYYEGMPISVLEAMACGLPIITRPVGGLRDLMKHGEMGFLEESVGPAIFSELLSRLVENPELCRRIGAYNRAVAKQRFLASQVAARVQHIHETVLAMDKKRYGNGYSSHQE